MEKINSILKDSIVYTKLKQLFLFLCAAFRGTFVYKIFFGETGEDIYRESIFVKLINIIKKAFMWFYDVLNEIWIFKLFKKLFRMDLKPIFSTSVILRTFCVSDYKYSLTFLICLGTLFAVGFVPTMLVAGLCLVLFVLMFYDADFKERLINTSHVPADMFVLLYMVAIFHARNVSSDVQRNEIYLIYTVFIGTYFILRYYLSNAGKIKMAFSALALSGLVVGGVGMIQFVTGSYKTTQWTDTNLFSDIAGRLVATFENPNVFGEYLLFIIPIAVGMFILTDKFIWKLIYGAVTAVSLLCMILTYSRGCWLGLMFGALVFIFMLYPKILLVGIAAPFALFLIPENIITRITSIGNLEDGSSVFRVYLWRGTINMIKDIWPRGIGLGTGAFEEAYSEYAYDAIMAPHCHNTFLHVMCESGIFGLIVFVLLLFFILKQLFTAYKETESRSVKIMSASLVCGFMGLLVQSMFDNTFYNYRMYMLFFVFTAVASALYSVRRKKDD